MPVMLELSQCIAVARSPIGRGSDSKRITIACGGLRSNSAAIIGKRGFPSMNMTRARSAQASPAGPLAKRAMSRAA